MSFKAVIFDMEGVLIASEDYWVEARRSFAAAHGKGWTVEDHHACMGRNTIEWARVMRERLEIETPVETIMADVTARIIALLEGHLPLLPGAVEAVHAAKVHYRVALASGSPTAVIDFVLASTGLKTVFETVVYGDAIERGKPHPDIYLEAARRLGVEPADCLGIEDSSNGVRALRAAGMFTLAVPSPGFPLADEVLALADHVLPSLQGFTPEVIAALRN